jgi:DNA invertase Pin-like site-specific DNA recombinase
LASVAQWQREYTAELCREGQREAMRRGVQFGQKPLANQETLQMIKSLRETGSTLAAIALRLSQERVPTKRGGKWSAEQVRLILSRKAA